MSNFLTLAAKLTLDGTGFKAGLKEAEVASNKFAGGIKSQMLGAFGAAAIATAVKGTIDLNSKIKDTADALGITTDSFQEQAYWLEQNGAKAEDLKNVYRGLSQARAAALGGDEQKSNIFSQLGISQAELSLLSIDEIFKRVAEGFRTTDFGANKIAAVMAILGKGGSAILPALEASLSESADEAHRLGQVIDKDVNAALERMGDRLDQLAGKSKNVLSVILDGAIKGIDMAATGVLMGGLKMADLGLAGIDQSLGIAGQLPGAGGFNSLRASIGETRSIGQDASNDLYNGMLDRYDPAANPIKSKTASGLVGGMDEGETEKAAKERARGLEVEASLHEKIWRLTLDRLNADEKRAAIQEKVNKLFAEQEAAYASQFSRGMSDDEKNSYLSKTAERMALENSLYDMDYDRMLEEFDPGDSKGMKSAGGDQSSLARVGQWQGINYQNTGDSATVKAVKELLAPARQTAEGIQKIASAPSKTINAGLR